jgi:hypothetical protein
MAVFMGQSVHHEPSDQTNLRNDIDVILGDDGGTFWKRDDSGAHRGPSAHHGLAGQPHLAASQGLPRGVASWSLLEYSRVGFAVDLHN